MDPGLRDAISRDLGAVVRSAGPVSGGDINDAYEVELDDGRKVFVKTHPEPPEGMFGDEAHGLDWLRAANTIRLPGVLNANDSAPAYLALEWLEPAARVREFDEVLGRSLAALHASHTACFGLERDNFIGKLPQSNRPSDDWAEFYWTRRLEPQVRLAHGRRLLGPRMQRAFDALSRVLSERVGPSERPARLHGDLWGGNLHVDERGLPCLIDPAAYAGHREVDLAMMRLFGGFGPRVFAAYEEVAPLAPGAHARVPLYQLYPLLVHVNLFGGGYVGSVENALSACV